jgi:hypothetical protein
MTLAGAAVGCAEPGNHEPVAAEGDKGAGVHTQPDGTRGASSRKEQTSSAGSKEAIGITTNGGHGEPTEHAAQSTDQAQDRLSAAEAIGRNGGRGHAKPRALVPQRTGEADGLRPDGSRRPR